jgi:cation:H+ antiporter
VDVAVGVLTFLLGLAVLLYFAERLVDAVVGSSLALGVSAFFVSVVFIGFDPENLAVGVSGAVDNRPGIVLGTVLGAAMVAISLAFGLTALLSPMRFRQAPTSVLLTPLVATMLFVALAADGTLNRVDGAVLLGAFVLAVAHLYRLGRRGVDITADSEAAHAVTGDPPRSRLRSIGLLVLSLIGVAVGGELLVWASERLIAGAGMSETAFGMSVLALAVSGEELARELPAAAKGRPDITVGNVVGSALAFFLFNAGIIALVRPISVPREVLAVQMPIFGLTLLVITASIVFRRSVRRWTGALLVALYIAFLTTLYT